MKNKGCPISYSLTKKNCAQCMNLIYSNKNVCTNMENSKVRNLKNTWNMRRMRHVCCNLFTISLRETENKTFPSSLFFFIHFWIEHRDGKGNIIVNKNYVKVMKNMLLTCEGCVGYSIGILVVWWGWYECLGKERKWA